MSTTEGPRPISPFEKARIAQAGTEIERQRQEREQRRRDTMLAARPKRPTPPTTGTARFTMRMNVGVRDAIATEAKLQGQSLSNFAAAAAMAYAARLYFERGGTGTPLFDGPSEAR